MSGLEEMYHTEDAIPETPVKRLFRGVLEGASPWVPHARQFVMCRFWTETASDDAENKVRTGVTFRQMESREALYLPAVPSANSSRRRMQTADRSRSACALNTTPDPRPDPRRSHHATRHRALLERMRGRRFSERPDWGASSTASAFPRRPML
jgi:hypothetical protein